MTPHEHTALAAARMALSIISNDAVDAKRWDEFASSAPSATLYHLFSWKRVIEDTFAHRTFYLSVASDSGTVEGILPLAQLRSPIFGNMLVSLPFFNYGGICATSSNGRQRLLEAAVAVARDTKADFLEIRHEDTEWYQEQPGTSNKVSMRLALPATPAELWSSFPSKLRSQIQRPRKEGMTAVIGRTDQLDAFYAVFSANMRDLGTPVYPKAFFRNILTTFPDQTWIVAVYRETLPVAAGFLAGFRDRVEIPWASSLRAFNKFGANMMLYWRSLEFACERRYRVFDFGRSTPGGGTYRFKAQWGAEPTPLYRYYWLRNGGKVPEINPANPKYRAAITVWQNLPLAVTRCLGPHIVKYIP